MAIGRPEFGDTRERSRQLHEKHGVSASIKYEDIDATNIPYRDYFDVVVFKSVLGRIGYHNNKAGQQRAVEEIRKALKPGGTLLFAENLVGTRIHRWARERYTSWGQSWRYVTSCEMKEFLKDYSFSEKHTTGVTALFGRTEGQRSLLSWTDDVLLNRLVPETWKYMVYGIARK